ncbi:hypothetical protein ACIBEF_23190 [Micromonospora sp. NPDC050795]|uniref:hypothetical protein n=1 Tax=Micromonospora sp. NPDC050795 TaxID=3364282 RepID=UPI00379A21EC
MGGHERTQQVLALLGRNSTYEVLSTMEATGGTATFAQIANATPHPAAILRAMAAYGFVVSLNGGTLDSDPRAETPFSLTAKGQAIMGHLLRLHLWMASRTTSAQDAGISLKSAYTEDA